MKAALQLRQKFKAEFLSGGNIEGGDLSLRLQLTFQMGSVGIFQKIQHRVETRTPEQISSNMTSCGCGNISNVHRNSVVGYFNVPVIETYSLTPPL